MKGTMTTATLSYSLLAVVLPVGVSGEAEYIQREVEANWRMLQETQSLGSADLFDDLEELADECGEADWDGYGAMPVEAETIEEAKRFARTLPTAVARPTVAAEPDGQVAFEWHVAPARTLSVSISAEGELHYSALIGTSRHYGTEPFLGECPRSILDLIERVHQL
jgi:hypothetical protein